MIYGQELHGSDSSFGPEADYEVIQFSYFWVVLKHLTPHLLNQTNKRPKADIEICPLF